MPKKNKKKRKRQKPTSSGFPFLPSPVNVPVHRTPVRLNQITYNPATFEKRW